MGTPRGFAGTKAGYAPPEFETGKEGDWERGNGPPASTAYDAFSMANVFTNLFYPNYQFDESHPSSGPNWDAFYRNVLGYQSYPVKSEKVRDDPIERAECMLEFLKEREELSNEQHSHDLLSSILQVSYSNVQ